MAGRPRYKPTPADRNTVLSMAAQGFRHEEIAMCLGDHGIDDKTMRRHFRRELDTAATMANATIGGVVFNKAKTGDLGACCFWLKCRAGWREVNALELSGPNGKRVQVDVSATDLLASRIASIAARSRPDSDNQEPE